MQTHKLGSVFEISWQCSKAYEISVAEILAVQAHFLLRHLMPALDTTASKAVQGFLP